MDRMERCGAFAAVVFALALVGCGGSPSSGSTGGGGTTPAAVSGVATPSSVSVVTAKNAN
ncbi:hypothetical protein [Piscinibacter sp.]|uniref:hypothetical protein n=1 Tax=Piscinibacter sp. TaxID=1903157 RepID=UPI00355ABADB